MRTRLNIPDAETNYAKSLGAQYDTKKQEWYIENSDDLVPFIRWIDARLTRPCKPVICTD